MPRLAHLISTPRGIGGAEKVMLALVDEGARRGWDQIVLNPFSLDPDGSELVRQSSVKVHGRRATSLKDLPAIRAWLREELRRFDPDLTQVYLFHALVALASLPRRVGGVRLLTHQHGDRMRTQGRRFDEVLDRLAGRRFDSVVACSRSVERFLLSEYKYERRKVTMIPNGWVGSPQPNDPQGESVICVANFREPKGHRNLLRAFQLLSEKRPGARLELVGTGPLEGELRSQVEAAGMGETVLFHGSVGDVWPLLARARVAVAPSSNETFGIAALEAMAAGVPLVVTEAGGLAELVEDGVNGLVVPIDDPLALSTAIEKLLSEPTFRDRFRLAGLEKAKLMRMEETAARYFELYESLLGR